MKKFFQYAFAAVIAVSAFTSCSDDDDPVVPGANIENKSYTATDGLNLVVNGEPLVGKTVTFTKGADDNATIKLAGEGFDLSSIMGQIGTKAEIQQPGLMVPTCGVIPGSPEYEFQVKLIGTGDECVFEGGEETEYCTFKYSGKVTKDALDFNITDLKLKNTSLVGNWKVPEYKYDNTIYDFAGIQPVHIKWITKDNIGFVLNPEYPDQAWTPTFMLYMMLRMSLFPDITINEENAKVTLNEFMYKVLHNVSFEEDGTIRAKYTDIENESYPELESPAGIAQYVVKGDDKIILYLNPQQIAATTIANAKRSSENTDGNIAIDPVLIEKLMAQLLPMLQNGVELQFRPNEVLIDPIGGATEVKDEATSFILGTDFMLPILKTIAPIFSNEELVDNLVTEAGKDQAFGSFAPMLKGILSSIPNVVDNTTTMEVGLTLVKE